MPKKKKEMVRTFPIYIELFTKIVSYLHAVGFTFKDTQ